MIVAVSDVHLGYEKCNRESFEDFIDNFLAKEDIEHLVLLGDILDFWRRFKEGVLFENLQILYKLSELNGSKTKKHYIIGNHDYCLFCLRGYENLHFEFAKNLVLESGDRKFRFIHGYQIEFIDILPIYERLCQVFCTSTDERGEKLSRIWNFYQKMKLRFKKDEIKYKKYDLVTLNARELGELVGFFSKCPEERKKSPLYRGEIYTAVRHLAEYDKSLALNPDEILVYGHTHEPFVDKGKNEANTGGWVQGACKLVNSYLIIDDGTIELKYWK